MTFQFLYYIFLNFFFLLSPQPKILFNLKHSILAVYPALPALPGIYVPYLNNCSTTNYIDYNNLNSSAQLTASLTLSGVRGRHYPPPEPVHRPRCATAYKYRPLTNASRPTSRRHTCTCSCTFIDEAVEYSIF